MPGTVNPIPRALSFHHAHSRFSQRHRRSYRVLQEGLWRHRTRWPGIRPQWHHHARRAEDRRLSHLRERQYEQDTVPRRGPGKSNPMYLHFYTPDVDAIFNRAVAAGARVDMPVQDMFWGDRYGKLTDPFGQQWGVATHKEDVSADEIAKRQAAFFAKSASGA